jgi:hypothetical protein
MAPMPLPALADQAASMAEELDWVSGGINCTVD